MVSNVCPVCGDGVLNQQKYSRVLEHKGTREEVHDFQYSVCDGCGTEVTSAEESRVNKRLVMAFRKRAEGLLSGEEIRRIRKHFGIGQQRAAEIFGGGAVAFSKYENDDVSQSLPMDKLLRTAFAVPDAYRWLASYAGYKWTDLGDSFSLIVESFSDTVTLVEKPKSSEYLACLPEIDLKMDAANLSEYENASQSA